MAGRYLSPTEPEKISVKLLCHQRQKEPASTKAIQSKEMLAGYRLSDLKFC